MHKNIKHISYGVLTASALTLALAGCGGGGGGGGSSTAGGGSASTASGAASSPGANTQPVAPSASTTSNQVAMTVQQNPDVTSFATTNMPYVTVTVCDASSHCVNIDHVLVDSGSTGLRVFASELGGLNLPLASTASGGGLGECADFLQDYMWGPVRTASVKLAGEVASNIPIQVVADGSFAPAPSSCSGSGLQPITSETGSSGLGAKGIIGVDVFPTDGQQYFSCSGSTCAPTVATQPVVNVVRNFATDNNGVMLSLPAVASGGSVQAVGQLTFGIDTQADNSESGFHTIAEDPYGEFSLYMNSTSYAKSIVDSGSNFYFLNMPSGTPTTTQNFINPPAATNFSIDLSSNVVKAQSFADTLELDPYNGYSGNNALPNTGVAVNNPGMQILGLPYLYGKTVAWTFQGSPSNAGTGPILGVH